MQSWPCEWACERANNWNMKHGVDPYLCVLIPNNSLLEVLFVHDKIYENTFYWVTFKCFWIFACGELMIPHCISCCVSAMVPFRWAYVLLIVYGFFERLHPYSILQHKTRGQKWNVKWWQCKKKNNPDISYTSNWHWHMQNFCLNTTVYVASLLIRKILVQHY